MGRFTDDMGRLREEIESERLSRQNLIADTRAEVTACAHAFISDLKNSVGTMQSGFRDAHADMAEAARADRDAFLARLGGGVADIRAAAADGRAAVREALAEAAADARRERDETRARMRGAVARMVSGLASERHAAGMAWRGAKPFAAPRTAGARHPAKGRAKTAQPID